RRDSYTPVAERRRAAGSPRVDGEHGRRDGDEEWTDLRRRRRWLHLRVRDQDRQGSLAREDPLQRIGESDDVSDGLGQAIHRHGHRHRRRQRAGRICRKQQMKTLTSSSRPPGPRRPSSSSISWAGIAPGKSADFIVLAGNPLEDITNARRIDRVYLRGQAIDRAALNAAWTP